VDPGRHAREKERRGLEQLIHEWASIAATLIDAATAIIIIVATGEAFVQVIAGIFRSGGKPGTRAQFLAPIRWRLGHWLSLALEVLIGGDIIRTAVSTSWSQLGQLAAIVIIRVGINYTLMPDIAESGAELADKA
jgi:uncharacterized membrane protein